MDKVIVFWKKVQTFHPDFINPKIGWEDAFYRMIPKNSFIKVKPFESYKPDPSEIHYISVWIPDHNVILEEKYFSHFKQTLKEIDEIAPECRVLLNIWDENVVSEDRFITGKHHTDRLWDVLQHYIKRDNYYLLQNGIVKLDNKKVLSIDSFKLFLTGENKQAYNFKRTSGNFNANKKYKMSCVFGRPRPDRVSMATKLLEADILHNEDFYYTLFDSNLLNAGLYDIKKHLKTENWIMGTMGTRIMGMRVKEELIDELKFGQWCNDGEDIGISEWQVPPCIPESLFTILFETHEYQYAFTEKMFKPIVSKVPFIWYGGKNTLDRFEALGYKRHRFVNYYFDKLEPEIRLKALYKEIYRLYHLPNLKELISNDQDILDHNYNNFWSTLDNDTERFYTTFRV